MNHLMRNRMSVCFFVLLLTALPLSSIADDTEEEEEIRAGSGGLGLDPAMAKATDDEYLFIYYAYPNDPDSPHRGIYGNFVPAGAFER